MLKTIIMGKDLERDLSNVEVLETTDSKLVFKIRVGEFTSEKFVRENVFGEGNQGEYCIYIVTDIEDAEKSTSVGYYGYTKVDSVEFSQVDDVRSATVTLRKPTLNEFISDVYRELYAIAGEQGNIKANVGGSFVDLANDNMRMMLSQLGGY